MTQPLAIDGHIIDLGMVYKVSMPADLSDDDLMVTFGFTISFLNDLEITIKKHVVEVALLNEPGINRFHGMYLRKQLVNKTYDEYCAITKALVEQLHNDLMAHMGVVVGRVPRVEFNQPNFE